MFELCGVDAPAGSSLLTGTPRPGAPPVGQSPMPSGVLVPPGPDFGFIFEPGSYRSFPASTKKAILLRAQELLVPSGDYRGTPDGLPGPMTDAAIKSWQTAHGVPATGQLDDKTLLGMGLDGLTDSDLKDKVRDVKPLPTKNNPVFSPKSGQP